MIFKNEFRNPISILFWATLVANVTSKIRLELLGRALGCYRWKSKSMFKNVFSYRKSANFCFYVWKKCFWKEQFFSKSSLFRILVASKMLLRSNAMHNLRGEKSKWNKEKKEVGECSTIKKFLLNFWFEQIFSLVIFSLLGLSQYHVITLENTILIKFEDMR